MKKVFKKIMLVLIIALTLTLMVSCFNANNNQPDNNSQTTHTHSYSTSWTTDETYHWHKCSGCSEISGKATHTFTEVEADGVITYTCSVCAYSYQEVVDRVETTLTITSDLSKVYDGNSVDDVAYETNSNGQVTITYSSDGQTFTSDKPVNAGEYIVKVEIAKNAHYYDASATATFTISKATPTNFVTVEKVQGVAGELLSSIDLSKYNLVWDDPNQVIIIGNSYNATYVPNDSNNYNSVSGIEIVVTDEEVAEVYPFTLTYSSGTENCYMVSMDDDEYIITFSAISEKTVYSISGEFKGSIVINVGDDYKFELEMNGLTLTSDKYSPIVILSGDKVTLTAKKGSTNVIVDNRELISDSDETQYNAAIYAECDLDLGGKGTLSVTSVNNKGIHTKDDLEVKNLTLTVSCIDNALKGNDSVTITSGNITLIARQGDGIKTSNSTIKYEEDGVTVKKIQGDITISSGTVNIYAACDGIDASHDVVISGDAVVNIYTDKYSEYSETVTTVSDSVYYIRATTTTYKYSIKYINSTTNEEKWVNSGSYKSVNSGRTTYYYYEMERPSGFDQFEIYVYVSSQTQGQSTDYTYACGTSSINDSYDAIAFSVRNGSATFGWTNYTTQTSQFPGGMQEGNSDKGDYSTKGIKADNEILISGGTIFIKSYDDAIHTNNDVVLGDEDDATDDYYGTGNIIISGGVLTLYSNDDGIHADGTLTISDGTINVTYAYEGLEGTTINIEGGSISVVTKDDGVNATTTSGVGISVSGGYLYIYAGGDGLDSNSKTSYQGIVFSGGQTVVINTSGGNSCIDTEYGYTHTGGSVLGISPTGAMTQEITKVQSSAYKTSSLSSGSYVTVNVNGSIKVSVQLPKSMSAFVIYLGSSQASFQTSSASGLTYDANGVAWAE